MYMHTAGHFFTGHSRACTWAHEFSFADPLGDSAVIWLHCCMQGYCAGAPLSTAGTESLLARSAERQGAVC